MAGQVALYALFAGVIGVFSQWPVYQHLDASDALIKVSMTHAGKPVGDCLAVSAAELAKLPAHMRAPQQCPRERSPIVVEVDVNGVSVLRRSAAPAGLSKDGAAALYERVVVPAGDVRIAVRMSDDVRATGFTHQREFALHLRPAQVLVVDFNAEKGGITAQ